MDRVLEILRRRGFAPLGASRSNSAVQLRVLHMHCAAQTLRYVQQRIVCPADAGIFLPRPGLSQYPGGQTIRLM